jgi:D-psicose/D-tagatose/L-ribulose 3-epimerase
VPWPSIFGALQDIQYDRWIVVESFGHAIPELAGAACVWRPLAPSPEQLARDSLRYLRAHPISTAQPRRK